MAVKDEKILGFLGLGAMGTAMCYGLVKCGFQVVLPAYRREIDTAAGFSPVAPDAEAKAARYDEMLAGTGIAAASQRELIEKADVLLISMPTSRQVEGLMYGEDGIMECIRPGSAVIDLTSADPNSTKKLAAELEKKGVDMLDCPISGGTVGASNQTLAVMAGGKREVFEKYREVLETIGAPEKVTYVGPSGAGDTMKCANNFLSACCVAATTEALMVTAKAGINPHTACKVIAGSGGRNDAAMYKFPSLVFPGKNLGMAVSLMLKDVNLFNEAAKASDVPAFVGNLIYQLWHVAVAEQDGGKDLVRFVEMYEKWCGVKLRGIDKEEN